MSAINEVELMKQLMCKFLICTLENGKEAICTLFYFYIIFTEILQAPSSSGSNITLFWVRLEYRFLMFCSNNVRFFKP